MDDMSRLLVDMGINLTTLAVKGTASSVNTKIKAIKQSKNLESVSNQYNEIINELLSERDEAIRIAMTYKTEIERIEISDDDIEYLHATISDALDLLNSFSQPEKQLSSELTDSIKALISKNTLKSMQLLGFNYKKAIGEPLTVACSSMIDNKFMSKVNQAKKR